MVCLEFLNSKKNGNIKDLLKRNSLLIRLSIKYLSCIIKTQQYNY